MDDWKEFFFGTEIKSYEAISQYEYEEYKKSEHKVQHIVKRTYGWALSAADNVLGLSGLDEKFNPYSGAKTIRDENHFSIIFEVSISSLENAMNEKNN